MVFRAIHCAWKRRGPGQTVLPWSAADGAMILNALYGSRSGALELFRCFWPEKLRQVPPPRVPVFLAPAQTVSAQHDSRAPTKSNQTIGPHTWGVKVVWAWRGFFFYFALGVRRGGRIRACTLGPGNPPWFSRTRNSIDYPHSHRKNEPFFRKGSGTPRYAMWTFYPARDSAKICASACVKAARGGAMWGRSPPPLLVEDGAVVTGWGRHRGRGWKTAADIPTGPFSGRKNGGRPILSGDGDAPAQTRAGCRELPNWQKRIGLPLWPSPVGPPRRRRCAQDSTARPIENSR